jgi:hypothetical protein
MDTVKFFVAVALCLTATFSQAAGFRFKFAAEVLAFFRTHLRAAPQP